MNDIVKQNQMTLDQHVEKIQLCLNRVKTSLMDTALVIRECRDDLGGEIFGKDLAVRLGMSTGTLSKWLAISESETIKKYQKHQDGVIYCLILFFLTLLISHLFFC